MTDDLLRFIDKGRRQPTDALIRQAVATREAVRSHRESLERCGFAAEAAAEHLDALLADLGQVLSPRSPLHLTQSTARLWECKGRLLEAIEEFNRVGCHAFPEDAAAEGFNEDILTQGRPSRAEHQSRRADRPTYRDS